MNLLGKLDKIEKLDCGVTLNQMKKLQLSLTNLKETKGFVKEMEACHFSRTAKSDICHFVESDGGRSERCKVYL
jgi:hypothetical protein